MNKKGYSRKNIWGGVNHYDKNKTKKGHSSPNLFGGWNHYDD